jgi:putative DNA primase/helicase
MRGAGTAHNDPAPHSISDVKRAKAKRAGSQTPVERIQALVGTDRVLILIARGRKRPIGKDWQNTPLARMQEPKYLAQLNNGSNIGVLLGDGLATIDFDRDFDIRRFLRLNPKLRKTLRTRRRRGCNIWIIIEGDCPPSCRLVTAQTGEAVGEWRAAGNQTIIYGEAIDRDKGETEPTRYRFVVCAKPIKIRFDQIRWPEGIIPPRNGTEPEEENLFDDLRRLYGEPYHKNAEGRPSKINESFWAGLFTIENNILWEPSERRFYQYDGKIYQEESIDAIRRRLSARLLLASRQMNLFWLETRRTATQLDNIIKHLRGIAERRHAFTKQQPLIHLNNGVFTFENGGSLLAFSPEIISRNLSPIAFDVRAKCERFLNELIYSAMAEDDALLVQKYFGLCLFGSNFIQRFLILDGLAGRGKTQLATVIQEIVGPDNCMELRTRWLGDRFETYRFLKKTLLSGVDVSPDFLSTRGASVLKGLVGGDRFNAEKKGGVDSFTFLGQFCVIITSNTRLRVRLHGDIGSWRRRLLIVRYEQPPPKKKITDFGLKLVKEEGSGILSWALGGLAMLLDDVERTGDVVLSERQQKVVDALLAESDSLRLFLQEKVERAELDDLSVDELVTTYAEFCPQMGWVSLPITEIQKMLPELMLELFHVSKSHSIKRDGRNVRGYSKVRFKQQPEEEE